jgi:outer membrane protein assembly factor BamB
MHARRWWLRGLRFAAVAAAAALIAGPARPASAAPSAAMAGWPQFQGGASHTGFDPGENSLNSKNVGQLSVAWRAPLPNEYPGVQVALAGGLVYASSNTSVIALNATTGTQAWQASLPGTALGTPSVQDGLVLVGADRFNQRGRAVKGFVVALNASTGAPVWTKSVGPLPGGPASIHSTSVTTTDNRAYVSLSDGQVVALGMKRGYRLWESAALPGCSLSQPSVAGAAVVVGGGGGYVSALNAANGSVTWEDTLGGGCGFSVSDWLPAISQGTVYAGLLDGVVALSLATGTVQWENTSASNVFFPLSVTNTEVIAEPDYGDDLVALSRSNGSLEWNDSIKGEVPGTATFGSLIWGSEFISNPSSDLVAAFGRAQGNQVYSSSSNSQGQPPVVESGRVYVDEGSDILCLALPGEATHQAHASAGPAARPRAGPAPDGISRVS